MTDARDVLRAWEQAVRQLAGGATSAANQSELGRGLTRAFQKQAEFVQEQLDQQGVLFGRAIEPIESLLGLVDQLSGPMRAQADALNAAAKALEQAADLLETQAKIVERSTQPMQEVLGALRTVVPGAAREPD